LKPEIVVALDGANGTLIASGGANAAARISASAPAALDKDARGIRRFTAVA
jgi:hypothetical protein